MNGIRPGVVGAILAAVVGLVLAYFFIGRGWQQWQSQRTELATLSLQVEALTQLTTALQDASALLAQARAQERLAERVPQQIEFETFFQQLQTQADERGIRVQKVQHDLMVESGDLTALPINLSAIGPLEGLYEFLGDMRNSKRLVKLEQVLLLATEDPGACELQLGMRIYAAAPPAKPAT